jgi:hypothetical protein
VAQAVLQQMVTLTAAQAVLQLVAQVLA